MNIVNFETNKPNIIFILVDDLGWGELGCYGNLYNETPYLDEMARQGMRFTTAYASAPVCSPSRAGLLTGQVPPRNGITDYLRPDSEWYLPLNPELTSFADHELPDDTGFRLDPNSVTMAQMFQKASYHTGIIGKWHLSGYDEQGVKFGPDQYGFDEVILSEQVGIAGGSYFHPYVRVDPSIEPVLGENEYLVDRMNYEAVEFIRRNQSEPFFLYLSHYAVHTALAGKPDMVEHFMRKESGREELGEPLNRTKRDNPVLAAMLKSVDEGVGMIRQTLEALGLDRNTLIVFTSDNGGETKITVNGHLRGGKSMTYEGGLRVPLVVSWPEGIPGGMVRSEPTINLDFYPTFADVIGYDIPAHQLIDGVSIHSLLQGEEPEEHQRERQFYWHYPLDQNHFLGGRSSVANRTGEWKLIEFLDDRSAELYNLLTDETESVNLAEQEPEQRRKQHALIKEWLEEVRGIIPPSQGTADE
ncbi:N-acetylgalactosamine-6-O-sulfatase [Paenibacillus solanacearum]|uniref:N-acetylgalactosamine-6-O-sulfatase n=1 Tax=Paenibacillus solanacearum TaxID=2048548 RepID=A0A916JX68_9BACL|nr:sulfatase [Paenibacillus solanacearum]CAG7607896.1 N-acetylgalactosamine-6-O-sulfatase [Paenibacillus solanacearum]